MIFISRRRLTQVGRKERPSYRFEMRQFPPRDVQVSKQFRRPGLFKCASVHLVTDGDGDQHHKQHHDKQRRQAPDERMNRRINRLMQQLSQKIPQILVHQPGLWSSVQTHTSGIIEFTHVSTQASISDAVERQVMNRGR